MNTPTHIMMSVAALTRRTDQIGQDKPVGPSYVTAAALGAFIPDAAMFVFYAVEKLILGSSEREIWSSRYFLPRWQDFFDLFNSLPIVLLGLLIAWRLSRGWWMVLFASMLLHIICDLPLHHDDGHRHFWPLSDWRYKSPVSYWDPNHFGIQAGIGELFLFVGCYLVAMRKHQRMGIRIAVSLLALMHLGFIAFAMMFWAGM